MVQDGAGAGQYANVQKKAVRGTGVAVAILRCRAVTHCTAGGPGNGETDKEEEPLYQVTRQCCRTAVYCTAVICNLSGAAQSGRVPALPRPAPHHRCGLAGGGAGGGVGGRHRLGGGGGGVAVIRLHCGSTGNCGAV